MLVLESAALWERQADGDLLSVLSYSITGLINQALSCETVTAPYFQILGPTNLQLLYDPLVLESLVENAAVKKMIYYC